MKLENLKLSEVIKLIEDKPDEIKSISSDMSSVYSFKPIGVEKFTICPHFWTYRNASWTVELKPIKKELTRDDLAQAWNVASNQVNFIKAIPSDESKFFKAICERLGL